MKRWGLLFFFAATVLADDNHYRSVLIGERAIGLGGAFVSIADDPSAVYYNPAGLAYTKQGEFNATANAFHSTEYRYRNIAPGQDYVMKSSGLIPSYFGFTNRILGYHSGFVIAVPVSDLIDQSDDIRNFSSATGETNGISRKLAQRNSFYQLGPGVAFPLNDNWSFGLSVMGYAHISSVVNMQYTTFNPLPTGKYSFRELNANTLAYGMIPKLGVLWKEGSWSIGASLSYLYTAGGEGQGKVVETKSGSDGVPITPTGSAENDVTMNDYDNLFYADPQVPMASLGVSYKISGDFLISLQFDYHGTDPSYLSYNISPTWNGAFGLEYTGIAKAPLRLGLYTDNANTPNLTVGVNDQPPHVDLFGAVFSVSFLGEKTSTTLGVSYALGTGQAQVIRNTEAFQTLHQKIFIGYFSGSYQL